jgi:hypothetical protein
MGKPVGQSLAEIEKCAWLCDYFAENLERFLREEPAETGALKSYVALEASGNHLGDYAMELPLLAGLPTPITLRSKWLVKRTSSAKNRQKPLGSPYPVRWW